MAQRTVKLEMPFTQLLKVIDQLTPNEKVILHKCLEKKEGVSWQERFGRALDYLGERNKEIPLEKVEADVARAVKEVRAMHGGN